jgi:hypothetical protein
MVVVSLFLVLAVQTAISLWRDGEAVEIDLRDLEGLGFGAPGEEMGSGEWR